jgi:hypothetical protein
LVRTTVQAGAADKAGNSLVSGRVIELTKGAMRSLLVSKLKPVAAVVLVAGACVVGGSVAGVRSGANADPGKDAPAAGRNEAKAVHVMTTPDPATAARLRLLAKKNLHALVQGLERYASRNEHRLPPPAVPGKDGKPLLSWRVLILPDIGQRELYEQFHLYEPWDSEHNKKLLARMPAVYESVLPPARNAGSTHYQAIVGRGAAFEKGQQLGLHAAFPDGLNNTICLAEAASAVPWTKPEDLPYDPAKPLPRFGGPLGGDFHAAFMGGEVRLLSKNGDELELGNIITRAGGETMFFDKIFAVPVRSRKATDDDLVREREELRNALVKTWAESEAAKKPLADRQIKPGVPRPAADEYAALLQLMEKAVAELDLLRAQGAAPQK